MAKRSDESKIDECVESLMKWATTGRICEDVYFWVRYQWLRVVVTLNPSWLSLNREAERQLKVHDRYLQRQYDGLREWLGHGFWRPACVFALPIAIVGLAYILPLQFPMLVGNSQDPSVLTGILKSIGAILASLTGILLAVTTLAIKNALDELPGTRFLLGAFARKRGFAPVAALLFGTLVAIAATVAVGDRLSLQRLNVLTFVNVFVALVSTMLLFGLLLRSLQGLGDTDVDELLRMELTNRWREYTRSVFQQILIEVNLRRRLAGIGFARHPSTERESADQIEYRLRKHGTITAVDLSPLRRIAKLLSLQPSKANLDLGYSGWLGGRNSESPCVTTPENGGVSAKKSLALLLTPSPGGLPPEIGARIESLVQRALVLRRTVSTLDNRVIPRLLSVLTGAVERRDANLVKTALTAFEGIFEEYLSLFPDFVNHLKEMGATPPGDFNMRYSYEYSEPRSLELDLSKMAKRTHENNSPDCTKEVLNCVHRLAHVCFEKNREESFREVIFELYWIYHSLAGVAKAGQADMISDITTRITWLGQYLLDPYLHKHGKSPGQVRRISGHAVAFLHLCLHMLKASAEWSDGRTFDATADHVTRFIARETDDLKGHLDAYRAADRNNASSHVPPSYAPERDLLIAYDDMYDHKSLAWVILGAWLMHKHEGLQAEQMAHFMEKIVAHACGFRDLLDLYAMPGMADMTTNHDNPLGFDDWDWPYSPYPKVRWGTEFQRWIEPFYRFLLLKKVAASSVHGIYLRDIRQTEMADHSSLTEFLTRITSAEYALPPEYQGSSWGLSTEELGQAKKHITELLARWSSDSEIASSGDEVSGRASG